ncbi:MAG: hypothetical protein ACXVRY_17100, partial [Gaiellaceae bacterium]
MKQTVSTKSAHFVALVRAGDEQQAKELINGLLEDDVNPEVGECLCVCVCGHNESVDSNDYEDPAEYWRASRACDCFADCTHGDKGPCWGLYQLEPEVQELTAETLRSLRSEGVRCEL